MLTKIDPSKTLIWNELEQRSRIMSTLKIKNLFEEDESRFETYSLKVGDLCLDYSKNLIDKVTIELLVKLAVEMDLKGAIESYFRGELINETEGRAVLHTALRKPKTSVLKLGGEDIVQSVHAVLKEIERVSESLIAGTWRGCTDKAITDIVNIGIGGSDLGPVMITEALTPYHKRLKIHFVSNIDGQNLRAVLKNLKAETTLFIVASKTFTTQETITNAQSAKAWFLDYLSDSEVDSVEALKKHFVAVSTNAAAVAEFGIDPMNMLVFWDWVGGRFSWSSAIGLAVACAVGYSNFTDLLAGAHFMDEHFRKTPFETNMPVILALLSIWQLNFGDAHSEAVLPYDYHLRYFPAYLQQMCMESNGKSVDRAGKPIDYQTGGIIWGGAGTNAQHSFFQLLHQGTGHIPCDFLVAANPSDPNYDHHHRMLVANCLAQSQALMRGKSEEEARSELEAKGLTPEAIERLLPYKIFNGNRPSNTLIYKKMTPYILGSLIALYEHKIFVQGVIWNIYSFDQWGVELGKQLANNILKVLETEAISEDLDRSTAGLLRYYHDNVKS